MRAGRASTEGPFADSQCIAMSLSLLTHPSAISLSEVRKMDPSLQAAAMALLAVGMGAVTLDPLMSSGG